MLVCEFAAGSIGGMFGVFAGHPFDTIKVNQQIWKTKMIECTKCIYATSGVRGFFRGVPFPLMSYAAVNSVFFGSYTHALEYQLKQPKCDVNEMGPVGTGSSTSGENDLGYPDYIPETPNPIPEFEAEEERIRRYNATYSQVFSAGFIAGVATVGILCPIEVIKVRQQTSVKGLSTLRVAKDIFKQDGFRAFYRGTISTTLREGPSSAVYMAMYHCGNRYTHTYLTENRDDWIHYTGLFVSGGLAGVASWWVILPVDVMKSHIQTDDLKNPKFKGMVDCAKYIYQDQGYRGFFRGFYPITLRAFPINGIMFLTYELFLRFCKDFTTKGMSKSTTGFEDGKGNGNETD